MAKKMQELPETAHAAGGTPVDDEWFDGDWWCLKQGEDFMVNVKSLRARIREVAGQKGLRVEFNSDRGDSRVVYVRAHG